MFRKAIMALLITFIGCDAFNPIGPIIQFGLFWKQGEATKYYATEADVLLVATKEVLKEFKFPIKSEETKDRTVTIKAGDDDNFKIQVTAVRDNVSKLSIRVNTFGDKPYAELIYRHVDQKQGIEQFASVTALNAAVEGQKRPNKRKR
jgi:stress response protein SCP2